MSDTARDSNPIQPADTNGLEDLFEAEIKDLDQVQANSMAKVDMIQEYGLEVVQEKSQDFSKLIPLSKAAEISGKARRYLLTLVHKGKLDAVKDQNGAWLVNLDQVQARSRTVVEQVQEQSLEVVQDQIQPFDIHSLFRELQAATFRNGYLESQISIYSEQVKLLPDLQSKAKEADNYKTMIEVKEAQLRDLQAEVHQLKRGPWTKFISWFISAP